MHWKCISTAWEMNKTGGGIKGMENKQPKRRIRARLPLMARMLNNRTGIGFKAGREDKQALYERTLTPAKLPPALADNPSDCGAIFRHAFRHESSSRVPLPALRLADRRGPRREP
jgi:hypothetical protein